LNVKTGVGITAFLGLCAVVAMALGILNYATIILVSLVGVTAVLLLKLVNSGKVDSENPLLQQLTQSSRQQTGDEMNDILDELEGWVQSRGLQIYMNWLNTQITAYPIYSLDNDVFWFYSFLVQDKKSGQNLHICIESTTQRIVKYGQTLSIPRELYWPQDYVPAIEALEKNERRKTSKSIKDSLEQMSIGKLQGEHDFADIPVDQTRDRDDGVLEAKTTR
jgi:uncharacterized membrane protein (Fun14 family)